MKLKFTALFFLLLICRQGLSQEKPALPEVDRIRLAEAFRLADSVGNRVWKDWSRAPFAVLLVTPDYEFLLRHPKPSLSFVKLGYDSTLKSDVFYRKRKFPLTFLATFPLDDTMVSTIVVGQAENTWVKSSTPWVVTLLHEHFHQLQDSQPNAFADLNALNLARGDRTGMWMLNYPFPYDRKDVQEQFASMSKLLAEAIQASKRERAQKARNYLEARKKFQEMLAPDDYKYISFQFYREGIARYTEYHAALLAAAKYHASKEFRALKDYRSFADVARTTYDVMFKELLTQDLGQKKREVVYSFGAAEGLLLDLVNPRWKAKYFQNKFDLTRYYPTMFVQVIDALKD
jgi:hypothetical protein